MLIVVAALVNATTHGHHARRGTTHASETRISSSSVPLASLRLLVRDNSKYDDYEGDYARNQARVLGLGGHPDIELPDGFYFPELTGRRLAFSLGGKSMVVADVRSGRIRKLGSAAGGGFFAEPLWSRDGRVLLTDEVLLDGNKLVRLRRSYESLAPDGGAVIGVGPKEGTLTVATASKQWRRQALPPGDIKTVRWSPDGQIAAYTDARITDDENARVLLRIVDREQPHQGVALDVGVTGYGDEVTMAWSPDGGQLAIATDDGVTVIDRAGGNAHSVISTRAADSAFNEVDDLSWPAAGELSVSGLGRRPEGARIELLDAQDGTVRWSARDRPEAWSPDGHWLLATAGGRWVLADPTNAAPDVLTSNGKPLRANQHTPDGEKALWVTDRDVVITSPRGLYLVNAPAATARRIAAQHGDHRFSIEGVVRPTASGMRLLRRLAKAHRTGR